MRLGIFGGTFDPPHVGHLLAASDACDVLALDLLVFVPTATQPLKVGTVAAAPAQRLEMTRRLAGADPRFAVDAIEIERDGLSYTVDTLAAFAARFPDAQRFFLVGADALATMDKWREPARVLELAQLAVLDRAAGVAGGAVPAGPAAAAGGPAPIALRTRRVDVSSTEIRARVASGRPIRGFVPDAVAEFIAAAGLYR